MIRPIAQIVPIANSEIVRHVDEVPRAPAASMNTMKEKAIYNM
jgi:hypothetical protein